MPLPPAAFVNMWVVDSIGSALVEHPTRTVWLGPSLRRPVSRIVSLVPSLTEAVFQIGAGDRLVGRTDFCVRPADSALLVEAVGGTKNPRLERVRELVPDVILANKEENTRRKIEALAEDFPVWLTDPQSPAHVPALWAELGQITGLEDEAQARSADVAAALREAQQRRLAFPTARPRCIYYVWRDPWMAAGHGTYVSSLLEAAGFSNGLPLDQVRFPRISAEIIRQSHPDIHFFSSEPYSFQLPRDLDLLNAFLQPGERFRKQGPHFCTPSGVTATLVDAQKLSWYPSLTAEGLRYAGRLRDELYP